MKKTQKIVLLDAHAIIHRAYHALPDFATRGGVPTGAIYGFITMVLRIIDDFKPDYILACYDLPGKTFRHETFAEYKGTRSKTDDALKSQFDATREACGLFDIPIYDAAGFEADDVLGTLAEELKSDYEVIIASGDMDTLQLVDGEKVKVFTLKRGINDTVIYDEKAVKDRFLFPPKSIIDYKALRGDASDNIPGIRGIGEKAATRAISTYNTIEELYAQVEKDEEKLLETGLTKRMIGLIRDGKDDAEFSKILATIRLDAPVSFEKPKAPWGENIDAIALAAFLEKYEFRNLMKRLNEVLGRDVEEGLEKEVFDIVAPKSEHQILESALKLWLVDSDATHAQQSDIEEYLHEKSWDKIVVELDKKLEESQQQEVYQYIEQPLIEVISKMQNRGIAIDKKLLGKMSVDYHAELDILEKKIHDLAGEVFNIKSPKQLSVILFETLRLPTKGIKKSKTGTYSTNIDTLEKLRDEHEVINLVIEYRELQKLLSTYIDVIPGLVADDGRLHAEFLQHGTATGRFSSRNPNLQNIPTRSELGRRIREGFVAEEGKVLMSFDYSQIELRILALLSEDPELINIFVEGRDIHTAVAARIGDVQEDKVDREMRRKAKVVNFGILYGMGINSLKKEMGSTKEEAQLFYNGFFTQFPQATAFLEQTKAFAKEHGYTETLFGRRRQFKNINSKLPFIRAMAERMALNAPIQGTAADIIKLAMVQIDQKLKQSDLGAGLVLQIHDELVYEVHQKDSESFNDMVIDVMSNILKNSFNEIKTELPLLVHTSSGYHWGELK